MKGGSQRGRSYLGDGVLDDLLVRHIALVADEQLVDALGGVAVNLLQPLLHVVERVHVGDIVDDTDAVGTAVVGRGNGSETLLAGGIPLCGGEKKARRQYDRWNYFAGGQRKIIGLIGQWRQGRLGSKGRPSYGGKVGSALTICSLTVLPSSSMVRIFWIDTRSISGWSGAAVRPRPSRFGCLGRGKEVSYEVDADGGDVALRVCVVGETEQQARLSYTGVSDEEELEEIVVSGSMGSVGVDVDAGANDHGGGDGAAADEAVDTRHR